MPRRIIKLDFQNQPQSFNFGIKLFFVHPVFTPKFCRHSILVMEKGSGQLAVFSVVARPLLCVKRCNVDAHFGIRNGVSVQGVGLCVGGSSTATGDDEGRNSGHDEQVTAWMRGCGHVMARTIPYLGIFKRKYENILGSFFSFRGWTKSGEHPSKEEPDHNENDGRDEGHECGGECHVNGAGARSVQLCCSFSNAQTFKFCARVAVAIDPNTATNADQSQHGEDDVEAFQAFQNIHEPECNSMISVVAWPCRRYTAARQKSPVLDTPSAQRLQPPPTSGVLSRPNFWDRCALSRRPSWLRGWERIPVRIAARLSSCVYPHLHPYCLDSMRVVSKSRSGANP